jgi:hypothetical protein
LLQAAGNAGSGRAAATTVAGALGPLARLFLISDRIKSKQFQLLTDFGLLASVSLLD